LIWVTWDDRLTVILARIFAGIEIFITVTLKLNCESPSAWIWYKRLIKPVTKTKVDIQNIVAEAASNRQRDTEFRKPPFLVYIARLELCLTEQDIKVLTLARNRRKWSAGILTLSRS